MLYKPQYRPKEDYVIRAGASIVYLDVYQVTWHKSAEKTVSSYTPFTAQPARDRCDWPDFVSSFLAYLDIYLLISSRPFVVSNQMSKLTRTPQR